MSEVRAFTALGLVGALLVALASGVWFAPFLAGLAIGLVTAFRRTRPWPGILATVLAGAAGWLIPLLWRAGAGEQVSGTARTAAALAGLPSAMWPLVTVALALALLQGLAGLWLGRAAAGLRPS